MANENVHITYKKQQCRVVQAGWYGPDGQPVTVGQKVELPLHDALHARALTRVEFC